MEYEDDEEREDDEGVADGGAEVVCPYCGEPQEIEVDLGGGADQTYVQDCEVCCRPWNVHVAFLRDGSARVTVEAADDGGAGGDDAD